MIEDKFGLEELGFQLWPEFRPPSTPSGLQSLASPCLPPALPWVSHSLSSSRPGAPGGVGVERREGLLPRGGCPAAGQGAAPSPLPTRLPSPSPASGPAEVLSSS